MKTGMDLARMLVVAGAVAIGGGAAGQPPKGSVGEANKPTGVAPAATPAAAGGVREGEADVSALLEPIRAKYDVPGMVAAIVEGDRVVAIGAAGVREVGRPRPVTVDDQWHIGSCTKSMTATMIGTLVDEGKLKWTTTIGEVFGAQLGDKMREEWKGVTLEQLLTHRGGVPGSLDAGGLWGRLWNSANLDPVLQRSMLVEGVLSRPPEAPPGMKHIYANAGFAIAGAMAEKVTGTPWEELMRQRLFAPLKMESAGFGAPGKPGVLDQPRGHHEIGKPAEPGVHADSPAAIGPGGTVHCSIRDWARYIALHLRSDRADPHRGEGVPALLKPETFEKLHTPPRVPAGAEKAEYAMGWGVTKRPWAGASQRVLTHNGSNTMWFCVCWLAPEKDFAVLVMCNEGGKEAEKACDEAAWGLIQEEGKGVKAAAAMSPATGPKR